MFFARISETWRIVKESFNIIRLDKEILLFPVLSIVLSLVVTASFLLPLF